jgi:hypothetical protein
MRRRTTALECGWRDYSCASMPQLAGRAPAIGAERMALDARTSLARRGRFSSRTGVGSDEQPQLEPEPPRGAAEPAPARPGDWHRAGVRRISMRAGKPTGCVLTRGLRATGRSCRNRSPIRVSRIAPVLLCGAGRLKSPPQCCRHPANVRRSRREWDDEVVSGASGNRPSH